MTFTSGEDRNYVSDRETLYRSVWQKPNYLVYDADGNLRVSSAAFDDEDNEISLFRHDLCEDPPNSRPPRMRDTDFVLALLAQRIREQHLAYGNNETYTIDVRPDLSNNQHVSHAVVFPSRSIGSKAFYKLKKRMAEIVEEDWPIKPDADFLASLRMGAGE